MPAEAFNRFYLTFRINCMDSSVAFFNMLQYVSGHLLGSNQRIFHSIYRNLLFSTIEVASPYCYRCPYGLSNKTCNMHCIDAVEKILENQLLQAHRMEAVSILAGGLSHDFNNLLTVILGFAGVMPESKSQRNIMEAATKASELTSKLLILR